MRTTLLNPWPPAARTASRPCWTEHDLRIPPKSLQYKVPFGRNGSTGSRDHGRPEENRVARKRRTLVSVRGHMRRLPNGRTTYVRRHTRTYWTGREPPLAVRRPGRSTGSARRIPTRSTSDSTRSPSPKASTTTSANPTEASAASRGWGCFGLFSAVMILASLISEDGERPYLSIIVPFFVAATVAGWLCGRPARPREGGGWRQPGGSRWPWVSPSR